MSRLPLIAVTASLALVLAACAGGAQSVVTVTETATAPASAEPTPSESSSSSAEPAPTPTSEEPEPEPEPEPDPLNVIESGTWIVPDEVAPGYYRVSGYWASLDDDMEIIENDGVYGEDELTIAYVSKSTAYLEVSGEAVAIEEFPSYPVMDILPPGGTYLVGPDIKPGTYRISDSSYAYAARLDKTLDIIDNEGNEGNVIITIKSSDFAFQFSGDIKQMK
jgi:hypothetical protein